MLRDRDMVIEPGRRIFVEKRMPFVVDEPLFYRARQDRVNFCVGRKLRELVGKREARSECIRWSSAFTRRRFRLSFLRQDDGTVRWYGLSTARHDTGARHCHLRCA
jgi:hypothetical protein